MMRSLILDLTACLLLIGSEPSAVMAAAQAEAGSQHKAIWLIFQACWCGWCHRYIETPENQAILPVAGMEEGLPFFAFLNEKGEVIATAWVIRKGAGR